MLRGQVRVTFSNFLLGFFNLTLNGLNTIVDIWYRWPVHRPRWLLVELRRLLVRVRRRLVLHRTALAQNGLLGGYTILVIVEVRSTEQETKVRIVLLLQFGHLLEFGTITRDELRQLVNHLLNFGIYVQIR